MKIDVRVAATRAGTTLVVAAFVMSNSYAQKPPYDGSATQLAGFALAYERGRASGGHVNPADLEDIGYFKGFVDGVFVSQKRPCVTDVISLEQVEVVVAKYLRENPERWGMQSRDLVNEAADRVWGCKKEPITKPR
jgi:hypothetical protein